MQKEQTFQTKDSQLNYLLYLPQALQKHESKQWPLLLFLHGAGERGDHLDLVKLHGVAKIVDNEEDFPFIAVSPQCPEDSYWNQELDALSGLLDDIVQNYPVDTDRIYLTGLSMGGIGAWHLALRYPKRFAAFAPICGALSIPDFRREQLQLTTDTDALLGNVKLLKHLPIWAFHGDQDEVVPIEETITIIESLKAIGGDAKLTIYEGVGHDAWTETYENPDLYRWFLQHSR